MLGYDLAHMVNDGDFEEYAHAGTSLPDIVLVRKSYQEKRRKRREAGHRRAWKLRQLAMEEGEEGVSARQAKVRGSGGGGGGGRGDGGRRAGCGCCYPC